MGQEPGQIRHEIEQTREEMGDTVAALGHKADVKGRMSENIAGKRDRLKERITGVGARANDATPDAGEMRQGAKRAVGVAQENPLGLAIGSIAVGFVAGMLVPSTRIEDERIGEAADQVKEQAREKGQEAVERSKQVVQETAESAKETAQESAPQQADELSSSGEGDAMQSERTEHGGGPVQPAGPVRPSA
jgi:gas vesicle protein